MVAALTEGTCAGSAAYLVVIYMINGGGTACGMVLLVVGTLAGPSALRAMCAMLTSIWYSYCWWDAHIFIMAALMSMIVSP